jgi:hypothetical protein
MRHVHRCSVANMMRRAALALGIATTLALPASASAALLDTLRVDSAATSATKGDVTLVKGRTYTLRVSGTFSEVASNGTGHRYDALFCTTGLGAAQNDCTDHPRAQNFRVTTGDNAFKDIDLFGGPLQDYETDHTYVVRFSPPATGVLRAGTARAYRPCPSCAERSSGSITVQVHGTRRATSTGGGGDGGGKVTSRKPSCRSNLRATLAASNPYCPFGVLGILPAPRRGVAANVGSAPLPDSTRRLNLVVDLQDPDGEGFFDEYVAFVIKPTNPAEGQVDGCLVAGGVASSTPIAFTYTGSSTLVACATLAKRLQGKRGTCRTVFVPGFQSGAAPSRATIRKAAGNMAGSVNARCSRPHGSQISVRMRAPQGQTLNGPIGVRAKAASGAFVRVGVQPSKSARLVYGYGVSSG